MKNKKVINTIENDKRTSTQNLMQEIWNAIDEGITYFEIDACGQHNIGGSVWSKNGEDLNFGRISHDNEIINENMLKNIPGIDENTKFYHKEITITPVVLPPLRLSQK